MAIQTFGTETMLAALERIQEPPSFMRDMVFSGLEQSNSEIVRLDKRLESELLATNNMPENEAKYVERQGFDSKTFTPPYYAEKMQTQAQDMIRDRMLGQSPFALNAAPAVRAQEEIGKNLAVLMRRISRREEWQACQVLEDGVIATGTTQEIDFGMPAGNKIAVGTITAWDQTTATPLDDVEDWVDIIESGSSYTPNVCVMGVTAGQAFLNATDTRNKLDTRRIDLGLIQPTRQQKGVRFIGSVNDIDFYIYARTYKDSSGTTTRYWPAKKVCLFSDQMVAKRHYGAIYNVKSGVVGVRFFPSMWESNDPSAVWVKLESSVVMALYEPEAVVTAAVIA